MRPLKDEETAILNRLLEMAADGLTAHFHSDHRAVDMADGGMGSIRFAGQTDRPRKMGRELVMAEYLDEDQVPVLISINLDEDGQLFELDIWKVNFQPLIRYPRPGELHKPPPSAAIGDDVPSQTGTN
jgi:hypothetical protein